MGDESFLSEQNQKVFSRRGDLHDICFFFRIQKDHGIVKSNISQIVK